jgi:hypothetical protein
MLGGNLLNMRYMYGTGYTTDNSSYLQGAFSHSVRYMQYFYPGKFCCLEVSVGTVARLMFGYKHGTNLSPWDEAVRIRTATPVSQVK